MTDLTEENKADPVLGARPMMEASWLPAAFRDPTSRPAERVVIEGITLFLNLAGRGVGFDAVIAAERHRARAASEWANIEVRQWTFCTDDELNEICGFKFHGGLVAIAESPKSVDVAMFADAAKADPGMRVLICDGVSNQDNFGVLVRSAAAFGFSGVIASARCGDPWSRRCIRQSMGAVLMVPIAVVDDMAAAVAQLGAAGVVIVGAHAPAPGRTVESFSAVDINGPAAIVVGHETMGISTAVATLCDRSVGIDIDEDKVDSLNVSVAAGILMQHFGRLTTQRRDHHG